MERHIVYFSVPFLHDMVEAKELLCWTMWERVYAKVWFSLSSSQISTVIPLNPGWPAVISANDTPADSFKRVTPRLASSLPWRAKDNTPVMCLIPPRVQMWGSLAQHLTAPLWGHCLNWKWSFAMLSFQGLFWQLNCKSINIFRWATLLSGRHSH